MLIHASICISRRLNTLKKSLAIKSISLYSNQQTTAYFSTSRTNMKLLQTFNDIVKSEKDTRQYRGLLLDNQMKCLLVSDPTTDRSAASVDCHVGYMLDPPEFPGLAHFCEHMLFMGSTKYPVENVFSKFIEDHAGSTNAYTSNENTNYHFEIATDHFKPALDIFAQFFIAPTFSPSSVDREILAVDSENQKNLQVDPWRFNQLDKSTSSPDHPYSKFGTGNLSTLQTRPGELGLNVRDALLKFHTQYYSSNLMTLCLLGKESLDELEQYAVEMFSEVPNKNLSPTNFGKDPYFRDGTYVYSVVPVQDLRQLSISWVLPDSRGQYRSNPSNYISFLIGHEGKGSLLSELKKKGWCSNLYAGSRREARGFQFFNLVVDLSEEGGEKIQEILSLVFQYLNTLQSQPVQRHIYDEINDLGRIKFAFKDKEKPINLVSNVTADMHVYDMKDVLSADYFLTEYEPKAIQDIYSYLTPKTMKVQVISKKFAGKTTVKETWYGTEYSVDRLTQSQIDELISCGSNEQFYLPEKNRFVPSDLSLAPRELTTTQKDQQIPSLVHTSPFSRLWFCEDNKFLLPKAYLKFEIRNPVANFEPLNVNMTSLFIDLFKDAVAEEFYAADLAGLEYKISQNSYGLVVSFSGFNDKMGVLVESLFEKMANFKVDSRRFEILKESYQRDLLNFEAEQPYHHSVYYMTHLLSERSWLKPQLVASLDKVTLTDLQAFIPRLLSKNVQLESLMYGNLTKCQAISYLNLAEQKLDLDSPLHKSQAKNLRQVMLPDGCNKVFLRPNNVHKTNAIEVYYQCGAMTARENALVELFCQVIGEASFNVLRTQEQLGYIVASGVRSFGGVQGLRIIIQSDRSPAYLDSRIEAFLGVTKQTLADMTNDEFKVHVDALTLTKLEEPKKMSKQCDLFWSEVISHTYNFNREKSEVEELKILTKDDLVKFFDKMIDSESKERRRLAIYIHPPEISCELTSDKLNAETIEDVQDWQNGLHLYPLQKPLVDISNKH